MTIKVGKISNCFASCYTSQGYVTFLNNVVNGEKVYVLLGGTFQVKSRIMRDIANNLVDRGFDVTMLHNGINLDILEGIMVSPLGVSIVDGDYSCITKKEANVLNLGELVDEARLTNELKKEIASLEAKKKELISQYPLRTKDQARKTINIIPGAKHMFAEAITHKGRVSYYTKLLEPIANKYYINNLDYLAAGQIISFFAKEMQRGKLDIEVYHNFLQPHVVELVIIRENNLAVGAKRFANDFKPINNTNVLFVEHLEPDGQSIKQVISFLTEINKINARIEEIYLGVTDLTRVGHLEEMILVDIVKNMLKKAVN